MGYILIIVLLALNFAISWFNANSVGKIWTESKYIGGFSRVVTVSGYIMSIAGFTMVYSIIILFLISYFGPSTGYLSNEQSVFLVQLIGDLSYLLILLAVIPTGIIITIHSLISFWKRKSLRSGGIAAWNTFATARNVISAARNVPSVIGRLVNSAKDSRGSNAIILLAIVIVLAMILGGYFTASAILKRADKKYDLFDTMNSQLAQ